MNLQEHNSAVLRNFSRYYMTFRENVGLKNAGNVGEKIAKALERADVEPSGESFPEIMETLSGGKRQCVLLARAMVGQPAVYLLDEVTSALDQSNAEMVERLILNEPAMVVHICHKPNPELMAVCL